MIPVSTQRSPWLSWFGLVQIMLISMGLQLVSACGGSESKDEAPAAGGNQQEPSLKVGGQPDGQNVQGAFSQDRQTGAVISSVNSRVLQEFELTPAEPILVAISGSDDALEVVPVSSSIRLELKSSVVSAPVALPFNPAKVESGFALQDDGKDFRALVVLDAVDGVRKLQVQDVRLLGGKFHLVATMSGVYQVFKWPRGLEIRPESVALSEAGGKLAIKITLPQTDKALSVPDKSGVQLPMSEIASNTEKERPKKTPPVVEPVSPQALLDVEQLVNVIQYVQPEPEEVPDNGASEAPQELTLVVTESDDNEGIGDNAADSEQEKNESPIESTDNQQTWQVKTAVTYAEEFNVVSRQHPDTQVVEATSWLGQVQSFMIPRRLTSTDIERGLGSQQAILGFSQTACYYLNSVNRSKEFVFVRCDDPSLHPGASVRTSEVSLRLKGDGNGAFSVRVSVFDLMALETVLEFEGSYAEDLSFGDIKGDLAALDETQNQAEQDFLQASLALEANLSDLNTEEASEREKMVADHSENIAMLQADLDAKLAVVVSTAKEQLAIDKQVLKLKSQIEKVQARNTKQLTQLAAKYSAARTRVARSAESLTKKHEQTLAKLEASRVRLLEKIADRRAKIAKYQEDIKSKKATYHAKIEEIAIALDAALSKLAAAWDTKRDSLTKQLESKQQALASYAGESPTKRASLESAVKKYESALETAQSNYEIRVEKTKASYDRKRDQAELKLRDAIEVIADKIRKLEAVPQDTKSLQAVPGA